MNQTILTLCLEPNHWAFDEILEKERREKKSSKVNEQLAGLPRQTASYKKKNFLLLLSSFVVTFFIFLFLLSFGQNFPSFAQKSVSFLLKQFPRAQCFSRSNCAWLPRHIFSKPDLKCYPLYGVLRLCTLLQKARKRSKSVNQTIFTLWLEPNHWALDEILRKRKKRKEIV